MGEAGLDKGAVPTHPRVAARHQIQALPGWIDDLPESTESCHLVWSTTDHSSGNFKVDKRPSIDWQIRPYIARHRRRALLIVEASPSRDAAACIPPAAVERRGEPIARKDLFPWPSG